MSTSPPVAPIPESMARPRRAGEAVSGVDHPLIERPAPSDDQAADRRDPSLDHADPERPGDDVPPALARVLGGLGRTLITVGLLLLAFAGFQLWGTGLAESRAQNDLADRFADQLAARAESNVATSQLTAGPEFDELDPTIAAEVDNTGEAVDGDNPEAQDAATDQIEDRAAMDSMDTALAAIPAPSPGDPIAVLQIPAIGVNKAIVEGTDRDSLRSGPGHYRSTPMPGQTGNSAIAGHRTTHGAPFFDIDLLVPGDEIQVETLDGTVTYVVEGHDDGAGGEVGHLIVDPSEVGVIADKGDNRLTLTACHPKYSAKQRIIVTATLVGEPIMPLIDPLIEPPDPDVATQIRSEPQAAEPTADELGVDEQAAAVPATDDAAETNPPSGDPLDAEATDSALTAELADELLDDPSADTVAASLGWQPDFLPATLLWAAITGLIALAGWVVGRFWRRWPAYAMTVPPFTLALFYCFANLEKFIPAV